MDEGSDAEVNPAPTEETESENEDMEEVEEVVTRPSRSRSAKNKSKSASKEKDAADGRRTSSRATKFKSSMKEPSSTSIRDLLKDTHTSEKVPAKSRRRKGSNASSAADSDTEDDEVPRTPPKRATRKGGRGAKKPNPVKSPAGRHKQHRLSISHTAQESEYSSDESSAASSEDEQEEREEEPFKIQRIIASRTLPRNVWTKICQKMNTSEIYDGSRWVQDPPDETDETYEERYLVKWADMSYLHVSWETEQDLMEFVEGAKIYLKTFFRKSQHGLLFSADERCDGDYYDPAWTQVDRILDVQFPAECPTKSVKDEDTVTNDELGIVLDKNDPGFQNGFGREFLVKWGNLGYTESSYEFERDLILNEVDYKDQLKSFHTRRKIVSCIVVLFCFVLFCFCFWIIISTNDTLS